MSFSNQEMTMHTHAYRDTRVLAKGPDLSPPQDLYRPARRHWPGIVAALAIAAVAVLLAVNETDDVDKAPTPAPAVMQPSTATRSDAVAPGSERPNVGDIEDTSRVIVTDQQPVDVSSPQSEETSPAQ